MSDIRKFAVSQTSALHLRDAGDELMFTDGPDGKPDTSKPMVAVLFGPGSKQHARAQAVVSNRMLEKLKRKGRVEESEAEKRDQNAEFLASCTESFQNITYGDLQGRALFVAVYGDIEIGFIADQVGKHLQDWGNFQKVSTTT